MKLIDNCTDLSNTDVGIILDELAKTQDTIYYGKFDSIKLEYKRKTLVINICYKKRWTKIDIYEVRGEDKE